MAVAAAMALTIVQTPDVSKIGPQVGDRVPEFSLVDQNGAPRTLRSAIGKNGMMLVFFRSADW